ncbi:MAG: hypothetical protein RIM99_08780 [Cyclobacteriaceae bacterium]
MSSQAFIVGDSGGTGAQWRVVNGNEVQTFQTIGFNAYTHNLDDLKEDIIRVLGNKISADVSTYLYSAGVDTPEQKQEVEKVLGEVFGTNLCVENDLVGSARALCGKKSGNVCILGTGSNACFYNGEKVNKVSASLGYVLGDEGSGAYLGKKLLMKVFREQISQEIIQAFMKEYNLSSHEVIKQIYDKPRPNHFLASFAPFILSHIDHEDVDSLVYEAFCDFHHAFFYRNKYAEETFNFTGSIAWHFSDILKRMGEAKKLNIENIIKSPIEGLVQYHQKYG